MNDKLDSIAKNIEAIKRLMIFQLLEKGLSQGRIAEALGVNQSTISRMLPKGPSKKKVAKINE